MVQAPVGVRFMRALNREQNEGQIASHVTIKATFALSTPRAGQNRLHDLRAAAWRPQLVQRRSCVVGCRAKRTAEHHRRDAAGHCISGACHEGDDEENAESSRVHDS